MAHMAEISLADFEVLAREKGISAEPAEIERLHDGYLRIRRLVADMARPTGLDTGLALQFRPEPIE